MAKRRPFPYYVPTHHRTADRIRRDLATFFQKVIYGAIGIGLLIAFLALSEISK